MQRYLKERELEILLLMSQHQTNREISEALGLGVETIRWYAKRIYAKLYVNGRKQAVQKAFELGLLDVPPQPLNVLPQKLYPLSQNLTSFIGRQSHVKAITILLQQHRLVTLTGTGGTGKTRLCIEITQAITESYHHGHAFVDLTTIRHSHQIPKAIADVLNINEQSGEDLLQTLIRTLEQRQLLLILDNFEHVIDGVSFVHQLLLNTYMLKFLVTSRESLQLSMEQIYQVPPLTLQSDTDTLPEAIDLFVQRAQLAKSTFRLTEDNRDDIQQICEQVDGLPLAIELLATHVQLITPQQIKQHLNDQHLIPANRNRDAPKRHHSIQSTIDWSYQRLSPDEQQLFIRLCIFSGGASLEAIEVVCMNGLSITVYDGLFGLLNKSMILQWEDRQGNARFGLLETLRSYGLEQLAEQQMEHILQQQYVMYFLQQAEQAASQLRQTDQEYWFKKLAVEYSNLNAAMTWALSDNLPEIGCRLVVALRDYWWYQGLHDDRWNWITLALTYINDISEKVRADLWLSTAYGAYFRGDFEYAGEYGRKALDLYQTLDDRLGMAWSYTFTGIGVSLSMKQRADVDQQAVDMMRESQNLPGLAMMLNVRGLILVDIEAYDEAIAVFEECYQIALQTGEQRRVAIAIGCLGEIALRQSLYDKAHILFLESLEISYDLNFTFQLHDLLWMVVALLYHLKRYDDAMILFGAVKLQEQLTGQLIYPLQNIILSNPIQNLQEKSDQNPTYQELYQTGFNMSFNGAIELMLSILS